ncbi:MAG: DUF190 domain-containing protein [Pseudomonadota bacterium]
MTGEKITVVRMYLSEGEGQLRTLLKRLHDWEKLRGVTVFRGISGYGDSGKIHNTGLLDLSLDLPLVVEFFDAPEKIERTLEHLAPMIKPGHLMWWTAEMNINE